MNLGTFFKNIQQSMFIPYQQPMYKLSLIDYIFSNAPYYTLFVPKFCISYYIECSWEKAFLLRVFENKFMICKICWVACSRRSDFGDCTKRCEQEKQRWAIRGIYFLLSDFAHWLFRPGKQTVIWGIQKQRIEWIPYFHTADYQIIWLSHSTGKRIQSAYCPPPPPLKSLVGVCPQSPK